MKVVRISALAVIAALLLVACGGDDSGGNDDSAGDDGGSESAEIERPAEIEDLTGMDLVEIEVGDNFYEPRNFRVDPGAEIVFTNIGRNPHNVTPSEDGSFETVTEDALDEGPATLVIDAEGDYPFYCTIHGVPNAGQTGYVVVGSG